MIEFESKDVPGSSPVQAPLALSAGILAQILELQDPARPLERRGLWQPSGAVCPHTALIAAEGFLWEAHDLASEFPNLDLSFHIARLRALLDHLEQQNEVAA